MPARNRSWIPIDGAINNLAHLREPPTGPARRLLAASTAIVRTDFKAQFHLILQFCSFHMRAFWGGG